MEEKKDVILNVLTEEWQSTTQIMKQVKMNWYIVALNLVYLECEGKAEKMETSRSIFWRRK